MEEHVRTCNFNVLFVVFVVVAAVVVVVVFFSSKKKKLLYIARSNAFVDICEIHSLSPTDSVHITHTLLFILYSH